MVDPKRTEEILRLAKLLRIAYDGLKQFYEEFSDSFLEGEGAECLWDMDFERDALKSIEKEIMRIGTTLADAYFKVEIFGDGFAFFQHEDLFDDD